MASRYETIDDGIGLDMLDDNYTDHPYESRSFGDNLAIADMRARIKKRPVINNGKRR